MDKYKGGSYENYDLEIKTPQELEEAKKASGVTTHKESMRKAKDYAREVGDKKLQQEAEKLFLEANQQDFFQQSISAQDAIVNDAMKEAIIPKKPSEAVEFCVKKRYEIQTDKDLNEKEKIDIIEYYDKKRINTIVENEDLYKKYYKENHSTEMENKMIEGMNSALLELFSKGDHMIFGSGVELRVPKDNPLMGLSFNAEITNVKYYESDNNLNNSKVPTTGSSNNKEDKTKVRFDINITETNKPHIKHTCSIYVDKSLGVIRAAVIPEGLQTQDPKIYVKKLFNPATIELESLLSVANLSSPNNYDSQPYFDRRVGINPESPEDEPTMLRDDEIDTLMGYRRRAIIDINQTQQMLDELLNNLSTEERRKLEDVGGGDIMMRVYSVSRGKYTRQGACPAQQVNGIFQLVFNALQQGEKALLIFENRYIPREVANLPPGSSQRPNTRRLRGKLVLAVGNKVAPEIRKEILKIFRKRRQGSQLTDDEQNKLQIFMDQYGLQDDDTKIDVDIVSGIHYKDGRFIPGSGPKNMGHTYTR